MVDQIKKMYPLLPLRDMVVFPRTEASLFVGRAKSIKAIQAAMASDRKIVLITQKNVDVTHPKETDLFKVGVLCEILQLLKMPDDTYKVFLEGLKRVRLLSFSDSEKDKMFRVNVRSWSTIWPPENDKIQAQRFRKSETMLKKTFLDYNVLSETISSSAWADINSKKDPEALIDFIAHFLNVPFKIKQKVLVCKDIIERADVVTAAVETQIELDKLNQGLHKKVRKQMDKMQRNFYLNEQMKLIREEMGEEDDEIESYSRKAKEKKLPKEIMEHFKQELHRMEKMPPMSAESTVVRNYLDWVLKLPWTEVSQDSTDLKAAEKKLEESHFSMERTKERIIEYIAVKQISESKKGPILCFLGPPGVGKTSLARSFADCLDRKFIRISLGGVRDEAEIRGHRRTYIGAMPGRIISALSRVGTKNPVILLDEIDKVSSDYRGNPAAALLEVLDPEQNSEFNDHYLEIPFDLSQVLFIATANASHTIPEVLLDRLEILEVSGYTEQEKINIASMHLIKNQFYENGLQSKNIKYDDAALSYIIRHYTKEAGVRQLNQKLAKICRKMARQIVEGNQKDQTFTLDQKMIESLLRSPRYDYGKKESVPAVGKCNGLAWTSTGGDILNIEAALAFGTGKISITGNLGDIMKESVKIAVGYLRSRSHFLSLPQDFFDKTDIYLHVPEGGIPKDGPSAGAAITLCLISAITQKPIRNDIALTGEITLRGMVLPIGGLREKVLAAFRGDIREVICPQKNKKDIEDIPEPVAAQMKFHFANQFEDVIDAVFQDSNDIFIEAPNQYSFASGHLSNWEKPGNTLPS